MLQVRKIFSCCFVDDQDGLSLLHISPGLTDRAVLLRYLRYLMTNLPPVNRSLLEYLLAFLLLVAKHSSVNKMAVHNLATVFAPALLRKNEGDAFGMMSDTPKINAIFNIIMNDFDYIFKVSTVFVCMFVHLITICNTSNCHRARR